MQEKCSHGEVELLGEEKSERGVNRYYKCLKCRNVLILSDEGILYEVPKGPERAEKPVETLPKSE